MTVFVFLDYPYGLFVFNLDVTYIADLGKIKMFRHLGTHLCSITVDRLSSTDKQVKLKGSECTCKGV